MSIRWRWQHEHRCSFCGAQAYGQAVDLAGQWRNGAGVVYTFTDSAAPPVAIALKDLGYSYSFNKPTTMIVQTAMQFFGKPRD
jgi:hypothetical protein